MFESPKLPKGEYEGRKKVNRQGVFTANFHSLGNQTYNVCDLSQVHI